MGKSIRTTSNTTNTTLATFKAGDSVLWAAVSNDTYKLQSSSDKRGNRLVIRHANIDHSFDTSGRSNPDDALPSLFHDTPANRQAIATLYGSAPKIKIIDCTDTDDEEVILMPSIMLSDIACDIDAAATTLHDVGQLLHLIATRKIEPTTAIALARLSQDAADTWVNLLYSQLETINEPLAQTGFGKVDACAY